MLIGQISSTFDDRFPHVDPNSKETTLGEANERVLKSDPDMTDRKSNLAPDDAHRVGRLVGKVQA